MANKHPIDDILVAAPGCFGCLLLTVVYLISFGVLCGIAIEMGFKEQGWFGIVYATPAAAFVCMVLAAVIAFAFIALIAYLRDRNG